MTHIKFSKYSIGIVGASFTSLFLLSWTAQGSGEYSREKISITDDLDIVDRPDYYQLIENQNVLDNLRDIEELIDFEDYKTLLRDGPIPIAKKDLIYPDNTVYLGVGRTGAAYKKVHVRNLNIRFDEGVKRPIAVDDVRASGSVRIIGDGGIYTKELKASKVITGADGRGSVEITEATAAETGGADHTIGEQDARFKSLKITTAAGSPDSTTIQFKAVHAYDLDLKAATGGTAIYDIENVDAGTATVGDDTTLQTAQLNETTLAGAGTVKYSGDTDEDLTGKISVDNFHLMAGSRIGLSDNVDSNFTAGETGDNKAAARIEVGEKLNFTQGLTLNGVSHFYISDDNIEANGVAMTASHIDTATGEARFYRDVTSLRDRFVIDITNQGSNSFDENKIVRPEDTPFHTYTKSVTKNVGGKVDDIEFTRQEVNLSETLGVSEAYGASTSALFDIVGKDARLAKLVNDIVASGDTKRQVALAEQSNSVAPSTSTQAAVAAGRASTGAVSTRLASLRQGGVQLADLEGNSGVSSGDEIRRNGMWLKGSGSLADQGRRSGLAGYNSHTRGMTLGVDNLAADDLRIGFALSTAQSKVKSKGADKTKTDVMSYQFATYGSYEPGPYFVEGQVAYALNNTDTKRTVVGGDTATGDFKARQYTASLGAGVPFGFADGITLTPKAGLFYSRTKSNAYTETGPSSQNLTVTPEATQILEANLGATLAYEHVNLDGSMFRPELRAAALYEFLGEKGTATAKYSGAGATVKTPGAEPAKFGGTAGLGIAYTTADGQWEVRADYDAEIRQDYISHNGMLTGRLNF